ncbi:MAG: transposase [Gammaproteobacteria bacterium]|nr:transposase [Gammaproteobacteria bacterium]
MARMARVVVAGVPYHVTQRGNRRQNVFFHAGDYGLYVALLRKHCDQWATRIWAYCLMPNHVHVIVVPTQIPGLARAMGDTHRAYTRHVNHREDWRGYLWQGRFASYPMDERHLLAAARYIELNPVRAGLCTSAEEWPWSSVHAHLAAQDDRLIDAAALLALVPDWRSYLSEPVDDVMSKALRRHSRTGRPLGSQCFVEALEGATGRRLTKQKSGPKGPWKHQRRPSDS